MGLSISSLFEISCFCQRVLSVQVRNNPPTFLLLQRWFYLSLTLLSNSSVLSFLHKGKLQVLTPQSPPLLEKTIPCSSAFACRSQFWVLSSFWLLCFYLPSLSLFSLIEPQWSSWGFSRVGQNRVIISCLTESLVLLVHLRFLIHCNSRPFLVALLPTYMFLVCVCASGSFFSSLIFLMHM